LKTAGKTALNSVLNSEPFFLLFCKTSLARYNNVSFLEAFAVEKEDDFSL